MLWLTTRRSQVSRKSEGKGAHEMHGDVEGFATLLVVGFIDIVRGRNAVVHRRESRAVGVHWGGHLACIAWGSLSVFRCGWLMLYWEKGGSSS